MTPPNPRERDCPGAACYGFTLVEMMVVVAVVALLMGFLLPAVSRAKSAARSAGCKANLHQLGFALRMYLDDFGKYPLLSSPIDLTASAGPWKDWPHDLAPFLQVAVRHALVEKSFLCTERNRTALGPRHPPPRTYRDPGWVWNAYGYNGSGCAADASPSGLGLGNPTWMDPDFSPLVPVYKVRLIETSEAKVKQPDDMMAVACTDFPDQLSIGPSRLLTEYWPARSHRGGANVLFCDTHVEYGKQVKWIEKNDVARRRWNNDHDPHPGALR